MAVIQIAPDHYAHNKVSADYIRSDLSNSLRDAFGVCDRNVLDVLLQNFKTVEEYVNTPLFMTFVQHANDCKLSYLDRYESNVKRRECLQVTQRTTVRRLKKHYKTTKDFGPGFDEYLVSLLFWHAALLTISRSLNTLISNPAVFNNLKVSIREDLIHDPSDFANKIWKSFTPIKKKKKKGE